LEKYQRPCGICDNPNGVTHRCHTCGVEFCRVCGDSHKTTCIICLEDIMEDRAEEAWKTMFNSE